MTIIPRPPLAGGGGGAFAIGAEVNRGDMSAAISGGDEIVPADLTKPFIVNLRVQGGAGGSMVGIGSWNGSWNVYAFVADGSNGGVEATFAAGESYFCDIADASGPSLIERTLG
jgi:hypothetical protein